VEDGKIPRNMMNQAFDPLNLLILAIAVVAGFAAGGFTIRHTGIKSLGELREAARAGVIGPQTAIGGVLGLLAGLLFILPGLISDAAAVLLLLPVMRRIAERYLSRSGMRKGAIVIDAEAVEITEQALLHPEKHLEKNEESPWNR
jgi:UPF0716 protein FxsA